MRCFMCDNALSDEEVKFNREHDDWEPCGTCLEAVREVFAPEKEVGTLADQGDTLTDELDAVIGETAEDG